MLQMESKAGIDGKDLLVGQAVFYALQELCVLGAFLSSLVWQFTEFLERAFHAGFGFAGIHPLTFLSDVGPIILGCSIGLVNMGGRKPLLDSAEPHRRG